MLIVSSFFSTAYAAEKDYVVLAPLPGITDTGCLGTEKGCTTTLERYLPQMFNLIIGIAAVLAFMVITFGGVTYATSDALQGKQDGKTHVENGIYGLLLVIGAWIILYTINPQILNFSLLLPKSEIDTSMVVKGMGSGTTVPGYKLDTAQLAKDTEMRKDLKDNYGIEVNAGPCTNGEIRGCTNLVGMPGNAYSGIKDLKVSCGGCYVQITGGTEGGHETHGLNRAVLDVAKNSGLDKYITEYMKSRNLQPTPTRFGPIYTVKLNNGQTIQALDEGASAPGSTGAHWHITFN